MSRRAFVKTLVAVAALGAGAWAWRRYFRSDADVIRERLESLAAEVNEGATDGLGLVARAATIGSYFADDVVVDLGAGSAPIEGRQTVIGMAARLQPRTSAFTLAFDDVAVELAPGRDSARVDLTATFTRREASGESAIDAREFTLGMRKVNGQWVIGRAAVVDALNKR